MNSRKGFTIAELLVAMTISVLIIGAVASVFLTINRSVHGLSESIDLNARTRVLQERIAFDVRNLISIDEQPLAQSFKGTVLDYATGTQYSIIYTLADGKLTRSINGGAATTVLKDLVTDTTGSDYSKFRFSDRIGVTTAAETTDKDKVTAIRFDLVPQATARQKLGITHTVNDPFCSALFQLRNRQGSSS